MSEQDGLPENRTFDVDGESYYGRHYEIDGEPWLELSRIDMLTMRRIVFLMLPIDTAGVYYVGNFEFDTLEELVAWLTS